MTDYAGQSPLPPYRITTWSSYTPIGGMIRAGATSNILPSLTTYTTANTAIFIPFSLPMQYQVRRTFAVVGASNTTDRTDIGVYTLDGTRLVSSGPIAPGNSINEAVISSPVTLDPGFYYLALNFNSTSSAKLWGYSASSIFSYLGGFRQAAIGSDTLPASVTPSALSGTTMIPLFGISNA